MDGAGFKEIFFQAFVEHPGIYLRSFFLFFFIWFARCARRIGIGLGLHPVPIIILIRKTHLLFFLSVNYLVSDFFSFLGLTSSTSSTSPYSLASGAVIQ